MITNGKVLPPREVQLTATTDSAWQYEPMTEWIPVTGIDNLNIALRNAGTTTLKTHAAFQTAAFRTDNPDSWSTGWDVDLTGDGELCTGTENIWSSVESVYWIRFGVAYKATTGNSFGGGTVWMQATSDEWGMPIATKTFQARAEVGSTNPNVEPVTDWMPAIFADKVKMAINTSQMTTLGVQPVFQTATTLTKTASAWSSTGMGSAITTNVQTCTTELPTTGDFASAMWVRFGVAYYLTSGSLGQGNVSVSVCVRTV